MARLAISVLAAVGVGLPAAAGAAESNETPGFDDADANGDGVVTIQEAVDAGVPEAEARREDINADDELTEADWKFVDMSPDAGQATGASGE